MVASYPEEVSAAVVAFAFVAVASVVVASFAFAELVVGSSAAVLAASWVEQAYLVFVVAAAVAASFAFVSIASVAFELGQICFG